VSSTQFLLDPQSLSTKVSQATFERGLAVYRNQQVLECTLLGVNSQEWNIEGAVRGSGRETYDVSVLVEASPQGLITFFSGDCSCPVGGNCKHSVALTLKAAYKSGGTRTTADTGGGAGAAQNKSKSGAEPPSPAQLQAQKETQEQASRDREHQQAQRKVTQWLDLFDDGPSTGTPASGMAKTAEPSDAEHFVYMLIPSEMGGHRVLLLGFGLSRRLRNGNWAKVKLPRYIDGSGATVQDLEIVRLIESLSARTYSYNYSNHHGLLAGATGMLALQLAAATDRLFSTADERVLGHPVTWGPAQPLSFAWHEVTAPIASEPSWALTPQLPDAASGAQWFANTPPLYLNVRTGVCGPVEMPGISAEHLQLLIKAPPIPQSAFALHETTLLRRLAGLPLPPVLKAPEVLQGISPTAHLHITPVEAEEQTRL